MPLSMNLGLLLTGLFGVAIICCHGYGCSQDPRQEGCPSMVTEIVSRRFAEQFRETCVRIGQSLGRGRGAVARTRELREESKQNRDIRLRLLIAVKLRTGRLPDESAAALYGAPGIGGLCDACRRPLAHTQLVMSIPWPRRKSFAHLHADCFVIWNAVRSNWSTPDGLALLHRLGGRGPRTAPRGK